MTSRPTSVRAILGIAILQVAVAWTFYVAFFFGRPESELLHGILLTASAYTVLAVPLVISVLKQNTFVLRTCLVLNILVSLPVKAIIGIVLSSVSLGLTFRSAAKEYLTA